MNQLHARKWWRDTTSFMTGYHAALRSWQVVDLPTDKTQLVCMSWCACPDQGCRLSNFWGRRGHTATRIKKNSWRFSIHDSLVGIYSVQLHASPAGSLHCCVANDDVARSVDSRLRSVLWLRRLFAGLPARAEGRLQLQASHCKIYGEVSLWQVFLCWDRSTVAPYSFFHLSPTLYDFNSGQRR
jgi:hypothetical protein